jgi:hypothetical protein
MDIQPPRVAHPVMYHQWNRITFLHWRYPSAVVQSFLPAGLTTRSHTRPREYRCGLECGTTSTSRLAGAAASCPPARPAVS